MAPPPDPNDPDPREQQLSRRSNAPAVSPWIIIIGVAMIAALAYVVSAMV